MTSRWMMQVQQRNRQHKQKLGNSSLTTQEKKFYRRKVTIGKNGYIIKIESIDEHLERMLNEAKEEQSRPKEPTRVLSRILAIPTIRELPLNWDEGKIISNFLYKPVNGRGQATGAILLRPTSSISDVEKAIQRYRRLTGRTVDKEKENQETKKQSREERQRAYRKKRKALKEQKQAERASSVTFSFKD